MSSPIHPDVRIGHVHLKVVDVEHALAFYCGVLGFQLTQPYESQAPFVFSASYHHHIGLNCPSLGSPDSVTCVRMISRPAAVTVPSA